MPVGDLGFPAIEGAAQPVVLFGQRGVGKLFERAATTRLTRRPTTRPCGQPLTRPRNHGLLFGDRAHRTLQARATPSALVSHQPRSPPERSQVHQLHLPFSVRPQRPVATIAVRSRYTPADMNPQRVTSLVVNANHPHIAQPHQQLTNTDRVKFHRDSPVPRLWISTDSGGSVAFRRVPSPHPLRPQTRRVGLARYGPGIRLHDGF